MKPKSVNQLVCCASTLAVIAGLVTFGLLSGKTRTKVPKVEPDTAALVPHAPSPSASFGPAQESRIHLSTPDPTAVSEPGPESVLPENGGLAQQVMRVNPGRVLATVNGVQIRLNDLIPLPKETNTEQLLSAEMYDFLFNRAVERELTFQVARAQGVELTDNQKNRLAKLRLRSEQPGPEVFDPPQPDSQKLEFEQRDLMGMALQATLAEKAGVASATVTSEQVEAYFQAHQSNYPRIPVDPAQRSADAWTIVDAQIRAQLAPGFQAEHDRQMKEFIAELKAAANVVVAMQE